MNKWAKLLVVSAIASMPVAHSAEKTMSTEGLLTLSYSDGRAPTQGVEKVNEELKVIGGYELVLFYCLKRPSLFWKYPKKEQLQRKKVKN